MERAKSGGGRMEGVVFLGQLVVQGGPLRSSTIVIRGVIYNPYQWPLKIGNRGNNPTYTGYNSIYNW